ncbi:MAG: hypothetical protein R2834_11595 [Rhodothermales bacterium]
MNQIVRFGHAVRHVMAFVLLMLWLAPIADAFAQTRFEGTAVVRVAEAEYTVPIECDDAARPELGFSTEPSRITRERTGRTSGVNLRVRSSGEPDESIVSLDRYVAWLPRPASQAGVLTMTIDLSPMTVMQDGQPVLLTRDMWMEGNRPEGLNGVELEARCNGRDPEAPAYRKISNDP